MAKEFNKEMLEKLTAAKESVKGTLNYYWYDMPNEFKSEVNGRWNLIGYYIPRKTGYFRKYKDRVYIITENERYLVTDRVKELLGI